MYVVYIYIFIFAYFITIKNLCVYVSFLGFQVKLTGIDRKAVGDEVVYLYVDVNAASYNLTLLTQDNGMASFSLDTSLWKNSVVLKVCPCVCMLNR